MKHIEQNGKIQDKKTQVLNDFDLLQESVKDYPWDFIPLKDDPGADIASRPHYDEILIKFAVLNSDNEIFFEEKVFSIDVVLENDLAPIVGKAAEYFDIIDDWDADSYVMFGREDALTLENYFFGMKYKEIINFMPVGMYYYDPDGNIYEADFSKIWDVSVATETSLEELEYMDMVELGY